MEQRVVVEPQDGSLGPLLRVADDRLAAGESYGVHDHRAVDVVAVVLEGALDHAWGGGAVLAVGDVGVLRAGTGLRHDERAGPDGAWVLQCYLRAADPAAPAAHEVVRAAAGWVELRRPDARLWIGPAKKAPDGLVVAPEGSTTVVVWQVDARRPDWAG